MGYCNRGEGASAPNVGMRSRSDTHGALHVPAMLIGRQADSRVETALDISFIGVELEELEPGLG